MLYFETAINKTGNKLQLIYNTQTGEVKKGFFLFCWTVDAVKMEKKQLGKLYEQLFAEYVERQKGGRA